MDFTDNLAEGYLFLSFDWDVLAFDGKEGVRSRNTLFLGDVFTFADALAQMFKFVSVIFIPHLF